MTPTPSTLDATITALGSAVPLWVDRTGIVWGDEGGSLVSSSDDWDTTTEVHDFDTGLPLSAIRDLDNGSLLVALARSSTFERPGELWLSDPTRTTWQQVDETSSWGASITPRTIDAFGPYVVRGEYGNKDGATNARLVRLSRDWGQTWETIYDHGPDAGAHVHGVCLDPRSSRIWVTTGDSGFRSIRWSTLDDPTTWHVITDQHQPTVPCVAGRWVLFGTDNPPNGLLRVARKAPEFGWSVAHKLDLNPSQLTYVAGMAYRRPGAGNPLLIPYRVAQDGLSGRLLATLDGENIFEMWPDEETYGNPHGLVWAGGPTANGKILAHLSRPDGQYLLTADAPTWA